MPFIAIGRVFTACLGVLLWALPTQASVFKNDTRWPQDTSGYTSIPVCIVEGSTAEQRDTQCYGCIHEANPSLNEVISHVRRALASSWERYNSVRFVGWKSCNALTSEERAVTVGLYIHPDSPNQSNVGIGTRGRDIGTQFKPWGNDTACINYNSWTTHMDYRFDCVEQYAIHEFGHALGFEHEWAHPQKPSSCTQADEGMPVPLVSGATYPNNTSFTVVNPSNYDMDSIMTYVDGCADVTGERFGSPNLSYWDDVGLRTVYPPPDQSSQAVGVIPEGESCGFGEPPLIISMDDEDSNNQSHTSGWVGATAVSNGHTVLRLCRVDGRKFRPLSPGYNPTGTAHYAVVKLGASCPAGSIEFSRYFDNEDSGNDNFATGAFSSSSQGSTSTALSFCLFRPESWPEHVTALPELGFSYGVFASADLLRHQGNASGYFYTDDEDSNNNNAYYAPDSQSRADALRIVTEGTNTQLFTVRADGFQYWRPSEPNGQYDENCAEQWDDGGWNDSLCWREQNFACRNTAGDWYVTSRVGAWSEGFGACTAETNGTYRFATPRSWSDNQRLSAARSQRGLYRVWLSYADLRNEGVWRIQSAFEAWNAGEPNNYDGAEHCTHMAASGTWNDWFCSERLRYACKGGDGSWFIPGPTGAWEDGPNACAPWGRFAAPSSTLDNQRLHELRQWVGVTDLWLNLTDARAEGRWEAQPAFEFWRDGEPSDSGDEDCAEQSTPDGRWNDMPCGSALPYACRNAGGDWFITYSSGGWSDGPIMCEREAPGGYVFAVPVSALDNLKLAVARSARGGASVWLNYTDAPGEGSWR